jgi:hypothetical protein
MQRLAALAPEWIVRDGREVGISFACPVCSQWGAELAGAHAVSVLFVNPVDGGMPLDADPAARGDNGGKRWTRTGSTFADLSLSPSINVGPDRCWHGHVLGGVVT